MRVRTPRATWSNSLAATPARFASFCACATGEAIEVVDSAGHAYSARCVSREARQCACCCARLAAGGGPAADHARARRPERLEDGLRHRKRHGGRVGRVRAVFLGADAPASGQVKPKSSAGAASREDAAQQSGRTLRAAGGRSRVPGAPSWTCFPGLRSRAAGLGSGPAGVRWRSASAGLLARRGKRADRDRPEGGLSHAEAEAATARGARSDLAGAPHLAHGDGRAGGRGRALCAAF